HCSNKSSRCRSDMNILAAWQRGYTGKNVVVTILDDGIERNHSDLAQNYDPLASYDFNGNDLDPTPRYDASNENKHGTRCAGIVAAVANNSYCAVGIAYNARIGGVRMLDGDVTDVIEAKSLSMNSDYVDIYSASWGPDDDGKTVDGPGPLAVRAFQEGIKKGRRGLGSIFVWASGNGGRQGDHCSCDGYTNSIYTISTGSTTENGNKPWYLEECSSTLATTYSSGEFYDRKIVTADLRQRCTDGHTGTSVSAPMVAGIIALALEANPLLTWRDVQHLIVKTSRPVHLKAPDWKINGVGRKVSHLYGFGMMDAEAIVIEAKKWRSVPLQHVCTVTTEKRPRFIRTEQPLRTTVFMTGCSDNSERRVVYLEHVVVRVTIVHPRRGDLQISLISPSKTKSQLLARRIFDHSTEGFKSWEFMTVHCWGEEAKGEWTLEVSDVPSQLRNPAVQGRLKEWTLVLYGTSEHPYSLHSSHNARSRMLEISSTDSDMREFGEDEEEYNGPAIFNFLIFMTCPCHSECGSQGCDGPNSTHCLKCSHFSLGSFKSGRKCVNECPLGYYGDAGARRCRRCHKGCELCVGRNPNECRSCRRGFYFHREMSTCLLSCPAGFFADESQKLCLKCHQSCKKCVRDPDRCTACKEGFRQSVLIVHLCWSLNHCPSGYHQKKKITCLTTHSFCKRCFHVGPQGSKKEDCSQCAKDLFVHDWKCVPACGEGFYPEEILGLPHKFCRRCEEACISCEGSRRNCLKCKEGYNLLGGLCIANATCTNGKNSKFLEIVLFSNNVLLTKHFSAFCFSTLMLYF
uniref:Proprotein convertase subtilisin/kexin type 6 n=1 Tax=Latimeria chalumnae TaxID=7897 RepID=H3BFU4_LATCH